MMSESAILADIRLQLSRGDTRLFRNNSATGWGGKIVARGKDTITLANPHVLHVGLIRGSADLIGWKTVIIGGMRLAVFASVEVKSATGRVEPHQTAWADAVRRAGGLAGTARSVDEARAILTVP